MKIPKIKEDVLIMTYWEQKTMREHTEAMNRLTEALNNHTEAMQEFIKKAPHTIWLEHV